MAVAIWTDRRQNSSMGQTRLEQVEEAEKIYEWLIFQRQLAGDLIRNCTKTIINKDEAADARLDLYMIVRHLAAAAAPGSRNAIWQTYEHHFDGDRNRETFFGKLRSLTRHVASTALVSVGKLEGEPDGEPDKSVRWNASLLPRNIAPHVLRVAILHPGILENFLPRFFIKASKLLAQKSTYRRAILILHSVPRFGWSDEKHTKMLIELGALDPLVDASEVETVKKFIRDLRKRYQKYLNKKDQTPLS
jgi:hypothetical protein